jgi:hypothetical protein
LFTLNNFGDGSLVLLLFSLIQRDENVKIIIRDFGTEGVNSLTEYAKFPGKI